ncbi:MAG: RidA family protein [Candidatus Nitrosopelagicus sp.]|jgi:enamine deaminase RidA (YjgF/YER057c/UK114 family)|nr:RidA family protein [Candidatus Nitrosopelagicus sp.]|tara:strand:- start:630 stop:1088 length:459 start_codon:yes stop_codon:yes gene_type:complete
MIIDRLKENNIVLPIPPSPAGSYIPVVRTGNIAFVSGQIPIENGEVKFTGKVPNEQSVEIAQEAAKLCIINGLAQLNSYFGTLDNITKIIRISGFVNSTSDFTEQPKIINAASDLLFKIFGDVGKHSRIAISASSLPLNSTVEIDMIVEVSG